jgi:predicted dehydrogenase
VGEGANVVVENGVKLVYYRRGERSAESYGSLGKTRDKRATTFIGPDESAPIVWEPEFSLGRLHNKGLFLLGYTGEVAEFARCVRENKRPAKSNLDDAREVMKLYEAFFLGPGKTVELPE